MKTIALCCLLAGLLFAPPAFAEKAEDLLGLSTDFGAKTLTIEVAGSGCTTRKSFRLDFRNDLLTVYRIERDSCKAMPEKIKIVIPLAEVGIDPHHPFKVGNRYIVNENLSGL